MTSRRRSWLLPFAFVASGATIGGMTVLLLSHGWTADWVETAGTWVGAVGTIAALLWAVHVFRSDQEQRAQAEQTMLLSNADRVRVTVVTSSGTARDDGFTIEDTKVTIVNDSSSPVRVQAFTFPKLSANPRLPILLSPGEQDEQHVRFDPIHITRQEFNSRDVAGLAWTMEFELDRQWWKRDRDSLRRL